MSDAVDGERVEADAAGVIDEDSARRTLADDAVEEEVCDDPACNGAGKQESGLERDATRNSRVPSLAREISLTRRLRTSSTAASVRGPIASRWRLNE